jgi:5-methylcytosine-specific restriction endonuclease McrA
LEAVIELVVDDFLKRRDPAARHARRESRRPERNSGEPKVGTDKRSIPAQVRDHVFVRDKKCMYVGPTGRRCESTHVLQVDHVKPVARGGAGTLDNLRLLCAHHNRLEAERLMGTSAGPLR